MTFIDCFYNVNESSTLDNSTPGNLSMIVESIGDNEVDYYNSLEDIDDE